MTDPEGSEGRNGATVDDGAGCYLSCSAQRSHRLVVLEDPRALRDPELRSVNHHLVFSSSLVLARGHKWMKWMKLMQM